MQGSKVARGAFIFTNAINNCNKRNNNTANPFSLPRGWLAEGGDDGDSNAAGGVASSGDSHARARFDI